MEKKNKIPVISEERLSFASKVSSTIASQESLVQAFLKGKEPTQAITIRFPVAMYKRLKRVAFDKEDKMNRIIVHIVGEYLDKEKS